MEGGKGRGRKSGGGGRRKTISSAFDRGQIGDFSRALKHAQKGVLAKWYIFVPIRACFKHYHSVILERLFISCFLKKNLGGRRKWGGSCRV